MPVVLARAMLQINGKRRAVVNQTTVGLSCGLTGRKKIPIARIRYPSDDLENHWLKKKTIIML